MDKNIIKKHLTEKFLKEAATPGIEMAKAIKGKEVKINKDGVAAIEKDMAAYDKDLKQENPDNNKMATNKFTYVDDAEKTYHDEMEILNGQEMIEYRSEPGSEFTDKAKEGIEGSSRMGNEIGGNAEAVWGASSDKFGKELVKRIKDSSKKRAEAEIQTYGMGDVQIPTGNKVQTASVAALGSKPKGDTTKGNQSVQSVSDKQKIKTVKENETITPKQTTESMKRLKFKKEFNGVGNALKLIPESYKIDNKEFEMTDGNETYRIKWEGTLAEGRAIVLKAADKKMISEDIDRMKALFNYKSESTLGLVKGNARLDENRAFADVYAKTKKLLGEEENIEDVKPAEDNLGDAGITQAPEAKKHIEGSVATEKKTNAPEPKKGPWEEAKTGAVKSSDKGTTAPAPKEGNWEEAKTGAKAPVAEAKDAKKIEAVKPKTGSAESLDDAVKYAPEAKKHIEGSVAEDKKTEAKKPKEAPFEEAPISVAPEATEHIEEKKTTAPTKAKTSNEKTTDVTAKLDNVVKQAPEAKKDIVDKKATATTKATVVKENEVAPVEKKNPEHEVIKEEEAVDPADDADADIETSADAFLKGDTEDNGPDDDAEPDPSAVKAEPVPPIASTDDEEDAAPLPPLPKKGGVKFMTAKVGPRAGQYFLVVNGKETAVPEKYVELLKTKKMTPDLALTKIQDEMEFAPVDGGEEGVEEGLFSKSPEEIKAIGMAAIKKHPTKSKVLQSFANDPAKADAYVMFVGNNPNVMQIAWDDKKKAFYDASQSKFGMASGA